MTVTGQCSRCGGDCPLNPACPECMGCENTGVQPCPACQPPPPGDLSGGGWDDEPCRHEHDEECVDEHGYLSYCTHQHCGNCGGCDCPGYCDDERTYNLRPAETGGSQ
jgi:hypothetical protein